MEDNLPSPSGIPTPKYRANAPVGYDHKLQVNVCE